MPLVISPSLSIPALFTFLLFYLFTFNAVIMKKAGPYSDGPAVAANRNTLSLPIIEKTTDEIPVCYIPHRSQARATRYSGRCQAQRKPDGQTSYRQRRHASA